MLLRKVVGMSLLLPAVQVSASCGYGTILHPRAENGTVEVKDFGYFGSKGPTVWVALDPTANALCASGNSQSPINLVKGSQSIVPAAELKLAIPDMPDGATFENLGTTVEVVAAGGNMSFGGTAYTLQQFHFHLPSEHLDNGASMAMEMHMVWQGAGGEVAVVGVFVDIADGAAAGAAPQDGAVAAEAQSRRRSPSLRTRSKRAAQAAAAPLPGMKTGFFHVNAPDNEAKVSSTLLETVLSSVAEVSTPGSTTKTKPLVMSELVDTLAAGAFQTYEGSLTTPPCSEGVRWLVSNQILSIQPDTFLGARSVIGFNSRFPQNTPGQANVLSLAAARL
ncbi:carbonic anhydrase [Cordyceps militaris]|uniref:carbonic anhydrase n=1 Tax=Cordyceps militaris TaxID=73501 RepID=A0A2H4SJE8_CORMI|nr:carbonic anhydrase [Cordyceps militaris]